MLRADAIEDQVQVYINLNVLLMTCQSQVICCWAVAEHINVWSTAIGSCICDPYMVFKGLSLLLHSAVALHKQTHQSGPLAGLQCSVAQLCYEYPGPHILGTEQQAP